jgi:hypothetical protein
MKSKLQKYSDQELINELERRKEMKEKRARNNLTLLISPEIKETIRIPKHFKRVEIVDNMKWKCKAVIYSDDLIIPKEKWK